MTSPPEVRCSCWPSSTSGPSPLRDAVREAGGVVVAHRSLTAEELVVFGMDVGDEIAAEAGNG